MPVRIPHRMTPAEWDAYERAERERRFAELEKRAYSPTPRLQRRPGTAIYNEGGNHGPLCLGVMWKQGWCRLFVYLGFFLGPVRLSWHRCWK
ncbi:MAG: hypothetical protein ACRDHY_08850 [Anaerolineales bacterium]